MWIWLVCPKNTINEKIDRKNLSQEEIQQALFDIYKRVGYKEIVKIVHWLDHLHNYMMEYNEDGIFISNKDYRKSVDIPKPEFVVLARRMGYITGYQVNITYISESGA